MINQSNILDISLTFRAVKVLLVRVRVVDGLRGVPAGRLLVLVAVHDSLEDLEAVQRAGFVRIVRSEKNGTLSPSQE